MIDLFIISASFGKKRPLFFLLSPDDIVFVSVWLQGKMCSILIWMHHSEWSNQDSMIGISLIYKILFRHLTELGGCELNYVVDISGCFGRKSICVKMRQVSPVIVWMTTFSVIRMDSMIERNDYMYDWEIVVYASIASKMRPQCWRFLCDYEYHSNEILCMSRMLWSYLSVMRMKIVFFYLINAQ